MLVDRLVDVAEWYSAGIYDPRKKAPGRPRKSSVQVMLADCAKALSKATGKRQKLFNLSPGAEGPPETPPITIARFLAQLVGAPLPRDLRTQIIGAKLIYE